MRKVTKYSMNFYVHEEEPVGPTLNSPGNFLVLPPSTKVSHKPAA